MTFACLSVESSALQANGCACVCGKAVVLQSSHYLDPLIVRVRAFSCIEIVPCLSPLLQKLIEGPLEMTSLSSAAYALPTSIQQEGSQFGDTRVSGGVLVQGNMVGLTISTCRRVVLSV